MSVKNHYLITFPLCLSPVVKLQRYFVCLLFPIIFDILCKTAKDRSHPSVPIITLYHHVVNFIYSIHNFIWSGMQVNYEANGWVAHQVSDLWAKTSADRGEAVWALWPMGGAWLCTHLWEHYSYTMDKVSSVFLINYPSLISLSQN